MAEAQIARTLRPPPFGVAASRPTPRLFRWLVKNLTGRASGVASRREARHFQRALHRVLLTLGVRIGNHTGTWPHTYLNWIPGRDFNGLENTMASKITPPSPEEGLKAAGEAEATKAEAAKAAAVEAAKAAVVEAAKAAVVEAAKAAVVEAAKAAAVEAAKTAAVEAAKAAAIAPAVEAAKAPAIEAAKAAAVEAAKAAAVEAAKAAADEAEKAAAVTKALQDARRELRAAVDELGKEAKVLDTEVANTALVAATTALGLAKENIDGAPQKDQAGLRSQHETLGSAIAQQQTILKGILRKRKEDEEDEEDEDE
jgi:hypothetical protein